MALFAAFAVAASAYPVLAKPLAPDGYEAVRIRPLVRGVTRYAVRGGGVTASLARFEAGSAVRFSSALAQDHVASTEPTS